MLDELQEMVQKFLEDSPDKFPQLTDDSLSALYGMAYQFYKNGKYQEASDFFRFLTYANTFERKHWMGLAASNQMMKKYSEAIEYYSIAAVQDPKDPYVHLHAADCFLALNQMDQAKIALDSAEQTAKLSEKHADLLMHLTLIQQAWFQNKERGLCQG